MNYENFKEIFIEDIAAELSKDGIEVNTSLGHVEKPNMTYEALTVTPVESNIGANISLEEAFSDYENNGYEKVLESRLEALKKALNNSPVIDIASITDYKQVKDQLVVLLVSAESNTELLSSIPHKKIEDMAVIYKILLDSNEYGRASITVTNSMLEAMGVTAEQLHTDALKNAAELKPAEITGMTQVMSEMMGVTIEELEMMGIPTDPDGEKMFVASTPDRLQGAGVLVYPNFLEQAAEKLGGSYYILPSSIHEVLLVSDNGQMESQDLEDMVREVNATQVAAEDKLTDNVYYYDAESKSFSAA